MNSVVHFEMPYEDSSRAAKFYADAFGWESNQLGQDMGDYLVVNTVKSDPETGRPTEPGAINGGMFKRTEANQGTKVVIAVDDIEDAMSRTVAAGGKIVGGSKGVGRPDPIPGVGLYIAIEDSEGNSVALLQPQAM